MSTATTRTTRTIAHPTAITAPAGSAVGYSSASDPGMDGVGVMDGATDAAMAMVMDAVTATAEQDTATAVADTATVDDLDTAAHDLDTVVEHGLVMQAAVDRVDLVAAHT